MATGFVQIRDFLGRGWGVVTAPPHLLANEEGARYAAPPQKPHPRIGPLGHVTGVPPSLKSWLRYTPSKFWREPRLTTFIRKNSRAVTIRYGKIRWTLACVQQVTNVSLA